MPCSGVAPLYGVLVPGLHGGQLDLARVILEPLGLERASISLIHLAPLYNTSWSFPSHNTCCALNLFLR